MIQCHTEQVLYSNDEVLGGNLDKLRNLNRLKFSILGLIGLQIKQFAVSKASSSSCFQYSLPLQSAWSNL